MSDTTKPDTRFHDQHAAAIYRAIALRFYERYIEMRHVAKVYGGDLVEHERLEEQTEAEKAIWLRLRRAYGKARIRPLRRWRWPNSRAF